MTNEQITWAIIFAITSPLAGVIFEKILQPVDRKTIITYIMLTVTYLLMFAGPLFSIIFLMVKVTVLDKIFVICLVGNVVVLLINLYFFVYGAILKRFLIKYQITVTTLNQLIDVVERNHQRIKRLEDKLETLKGE